NLAGLALAGTFYLETPGLMGGDVSRAESYQRKALALDPHFTRARVELGRVLIEQRRYAEARRELPQGIDEPQPTHLASRAERLPAGIGGKSSGQAHATATRRRHRGGQARHRPTARRFTPRLAPSGAARSDGGGGRGPGAPDAPPPRPRLAAHGRLRGGGRR